MEIKNMIMNKKLKLYPIDDGYRIYGKTFDIREELKGIGAKWNKDNRAFEMSQDDFSKLSQDIRDFVLKQILKEKVEATNRISEAILNENIKVYLNNGNYQVYGKTKEIFKDLKNAGFKYDNEHYQMSEDSFNKLFKKEVKEKVASMSNTSEQASSVEMEV